MAGIKKRPVSPRQKMINLMYVVLMAMLALNVSTDVLEGFSKVEEGLNRTTKNATEENANIYNEFEQQMQQNPGKVKAWYDKAKIVKEADGMKGDVKNIRNKEDLEAATQVMLSGRHGQRLYDAIVSYRQRILSMITDSAQAATIKSNLSTDIRKGG